MIPSEGECAAIEAMSPPDLLHYFMTRSMESEEVWGLGDDSGWIMRDLGAGCTSLPVWPHPLLAERCRIARGRDEDWSAQTPQAVSLEHFLYRVLQLLNRQDIKVELMPGHGRDGYVVDAEQLLELFESMMDAGDYHLEG